MTRTPKRTPQREPASWVASTGARKLVPVRLRVSNFLKAWVESYWRPVIDDEALEVLPTFVRETMSGMFQGASQRLQDLINARILASQQPQGELAGPLSPTGASAAAAGGTSWYRRRGGVCRGLYLSLVAPYHYLRRRASTTQHVLGCPGLVRIRHRDRHCQSHHQRGRRNCWREREDEGDPWLL